jgi:hypothetical protein
MVQHTQIIKFKQRQQSMQSTQYAEKGFNKIQPIFLIKALMKLGIYDKTMANIILNWEKLKQFPLKSGMTQRHPLFLLLFNIVLEFLLRVIRHKEEI